MNVVLHGEATTNRGGVQHHSKALSLHGAENAFYQKGYRLMRSPPLLLPPSAVTGIGSLPFREPYAAVQCVARQSLITATCGLGLLAESAVANSFHLARRLAQVASGDAQSP